MVGQRRKQELLGNHQNSWVWGRNVVLELLASPSWPPLEIVAADDLDAPLLASLTEAAGLANVPIARHSRDRITELCKAKDHQGLLAKMPAFPYVSTDELLSDSVKSHRLVLLDGIQDPFNLGAIARSAIVFGATGMVLGERNQTGINSQVVRSAAGAISRLSIARSIDLIETIHQLHDLRVETVATCLTASVEMTSASLAGSIAIVIGNEGKGIREDVASVCRTRIRITQHGDFDSLNAAVAAGVVLYEADRQQRHLIGHPPENS
jgi:23S rRNA (guanosine2251-2'-O)-methyltransferase